MASEGEQLTGTDLLAAVSRTMVALQKRFAGKGPTKCRSYWAGSDMLVILLGGGYTAAEKTLYEGGRGGDVRDSRRAFQDTMEQRLKEEMERLVGRRVIAFMSSSHQEPDLAAEIFIFEPREPDHPALVRDQRVDVGTGDR